MDGAERDRNRSRRERIELAMDVSSQEYRFGCNTEKDELDDEKMTDLL